MRIKQHTMRGRLPIFHLFILICLISISLIIGSSLYRNVFTKLFSNSPKAKRLTPPLKTKGTKLINKWGQEVTIKAVNYNELVPSDYVYVTPDPVEKAKLPQMCQGWDEPPHVLNAKKVDEWGFNAVRFVINWNSLEPDPPILEKDGTYTHNWNNPYFEALDAKISELTRRKIAVILDMHQYLWSTAFTYIESDDGSGCSGGGIPAWLYPDPNKLSFQKARCDFFAGKKEEDSPIDPQAGFIDAWQYLAARYKVNPWVIGADIINEPWMVKGMCSAGDLKLDAFYEKVGLAIRKVNPNMLLIFEDSQDFGDGVFAVTTPPPFENVVYSFHLYTGQWVPDGIVRVRRFWERSKIWKIPLFIGEFDAFGYAWNVDRNDQLTKWKTDLHDFLGFTKKEDIHWAFWSYSGFQSLVDKNGLDVKIELLEVLQEGF